MEVIEEILTSAKKSDFQNDYLQLNDNLSKKKEYRLEWVSRFGICPIAECKIHHANLKSNQPKLLLNGQLVRYPLIMIRLIALKTLKNLIESIRLRQTLSPVMLKMSKLLMKINILR
ncbi:hypothetical protein CEXT_470411 [Caerostris extrusa]|uniref:HNH homing endonuclease n=1 Tax=Caerostris extrusa TaxID=172846 RepID=A0AAV4XY00_CAEEX|nr:hypothetical protein CEXT_470411 [Caerostris extrusa]